jgi:hypothetical protein
MSACRVALNEPKLAFKNLRMAIFEVGLTHHMSVCVANCKLAYLL